MTRDSKGQLTCMFCGKYLKNADNNPMRVEIHFKNLYRDEKIGAKLTAYKDEEDICPTCAAFIFENWKAMDSPYSPCFEVKENDESPASRLVDAYSPKGVAPTSGTYSKYKAIRDNLSLPDIYGQLAEECCELAQAALKMQRSLLGANPTNKSIDKYEKNLVEELSDVSLCLEILKVKADRSIMRRKLDRWLRRLGVC